MAHSMRLYIKYLFASTLFWQLAFPAFSQTNVYRATSVSESTKYRLPTIEPKKVKADDPNYPVLKSMQQKPKSNAQSTIMRSETLGEQAPIRTIKKKTTIDLNQDSNSQTLDVSTKEKHVHTVAKISTSPIKKESVPKLIKKR